MPYGGSNVKDHGAPPLSAWELASEVARYLALPPPPVKSVKMPVKVKPVAQGDPHALDPDVVTMVPARMRTVSEFEALTAHAATQGFGAKRIAAPSPDELGEAHSVSAAPLDAEAALARYATTDAEVHAAVVGASPSAEVGDAARIVSAQRNGVIATPIRNAFQPVGNAFGPNGALATTFQPLTNAFQPIGALAIAFTPPPAKVCRCPSGTTDSGAQCRRSITRGRKNGYICDMVYYRKARHTLLARARSLA